MTQQAAIKQKHPQRRVASHVPDDLVVDFEGYEARLRGRSLLLTRREFELLRFLEK